MKCSNNHVTNSSGINYIVTNISQQTKSVWDFVNEFIDDETIYEKLIENRCVDIYTDMKNMSKEDLKIKLYNTLIDEAYLENELSDKWNKSYKVPSGSGFALMGLDEYDTLADVFVRSLWYVLKDNKLENFTVEKLSNDSRGLGQFDYDTKVALYTKEWYEESNDTDDYNDEYSWIEEYDDYYDTEEELTDNDFVQLMEEETDIEPVKINPEDLNDLGNVELDDKYYKMIEEAEKEIDKMGYAKPYNPPTCPELQRLNYEKSVYKKRAESTEKEIIFNVILDMIQKYDLYAELRKFYDMSNLDY